MIGGLEESSIGLDMFLCTLQVTMKQIEADMYWSIAY